MYQACIFDLDGTLTDTLESLTISVNETLRELGQDTITAEQCRSFVGDGARCLMERALKATGTGDGGVRPCFCQELYLACKALSRYCKDAEGAEEKRHKDRRHFQ